ncbi:GIGANTEA-like protein, partial [Tanacetum coccineum]
GRLLESFQEDAKYEHVGQDTRSQGGKEDQDIQGKDLKISDLALPANFATALLFRILSQPASLFPHLTHVEGVEEQQDSLGSDNSNHQKQREMPTTKATIEATAQGIASMLCAHGPEVERRICTIWEAAYGLIPLSSSIVDLPEIIVTVPLQPNILSWNLYIPLLKVLEYLPRRIPYEACLMKIFVATVEAILQRTFPAVSI